MAQTNFIKSISIEADSIEYSINFEPFLENSDLWLQLTFVLKHFARKWSGKYGFTIEKETVISDLKIFSDFIKINWAFSRRKQVLFQLKNTLS